MGQLSCSARAKPGLAHALPAGVEREHDDGEREHRPRLPSWHRAILDPCEARRTPDGVPSGRSFVIDARQRKLLSHAPTSDPGVSELAAEAADS